MLTLDLGNTSASVGLVGPGGASLLGSTEAAALDGAWMRSCLERALPEGPAPQGAAVSAVGDPSEERRVCGLLRDLGLAVVSNPDPGLALRIDHPETCGRDRLYAARGAVDALGGGSDATGLLVVDAGTALTVDAVALEGRSAVFLGGAIAPGPGTLARSLSLAGARLPEFTVEPDAAALGRSTDEALRAGVVVGFRGAVDALCAGVLREAFGAGARVEGVLTGGARAFARAGVAGALGRAPLEEPLLVHLGLAAAATP